MRKNVSHALWVVRKSKEQHGVCLGTPCGRLGFLRISTIPKEMRNAPSMSPSQR